jgi:CspA family cold shock protein
MTGTVRKVVVDRGFGFIRAEDGRDLFFHIKQTDPGLPFDDTLQERRVQFETVASEKGPKAINVRAV